MKKTITLKSFNVNNFCKEKTDYQDNPNKRKLVPVEGEYKETADAILDKLTEGSPDIIVLQEFPYNYREYYEGKLDLKGYSLKIPDFAIKHFSKDKSTASIVVIAINKRRKFDSKEVIQSSKWATWLLIKVEDLYILGVHVKNVKVDDKQEVLVCDQHSEYWKDIDPFIKKYKEDKTILIGDFNPVNLKRYPKLRDIYDDTIGKLVKEDYKYTPVLAKENDGGRSLDRAYFSSHIKKEDVKAYSIPAVSSASEAAASTNLSDKNHPYILAVEVSVDL